MKINKFMPVRQAMTPEMADQKLKDVATLYEKQFLREMMKNMRSTVPENGLIKVSQAEKIYQEQLDQEYVEKWGDKGGVGMASIIHKQLVEKYGPSMGIRSEERPAGPIHISEKFKIQQPTEKRMTIQYDLKSPEHRDVTAPWSGQLLGAKQISPDEYLLELNHDNGLKSRMVFRGQLDASLKNPESPEILSGQRIGLLSPQAKSFFWTVDSL